MTPAEWLIVLTVVAGVLCMGALVDHVDVRLLSDEQLRIEMYWAETLAELDTEFHREYIRRHGALPPPTEGIPS